MLQYRLYLRVMFQYTLGLSLHASNFNVYSYTVSRDMKKKFSEGFEKKNLFLHLCVTWR